MSRRIPTNPAHVGRRQVATCGVNNFTLEENRSLIWKTIKPLLLDNFDTHKGTYSWYFFSSNASIRRRN